MISHGQRKLFSSCAKKRFDGRSQKCLIYGQLKFRDLRTLTSCYSSRTRPRKNIFLAFPPSRTIAHTNNPSITRGYAQITSSSGDTTTTGLTSYHQILQLHRLEYDVANLSVVVVAVAIRLGAMLCFWTAYGARFNSRTVSRRITTFFVDIETSHRYSPTGLDDMT